MKRTYYTCDRCNPDGSMNAARHPNGLLECDGLTERELVDKAGPWGWKRVHVGDGISRHLCAACQRRGAAMEAGVKPDKCQVCGALVYVRSSDEGTSYYQPLSPGEVRDQLRAVEQERDALRREIDEALQLAEGPSTLKALASMAFERGQRMVKAETECDALREQVTLLSASLNAYGDGGIDGPSVSGFIDSNDAAPLILRQEKQIAALEEKLGRQVARP